MEHLRFIPWASTECRGSFDRVSDQVSLTLTFIRWPLWPVLQIPEKTCSLSLFLIYYAEDRYVEWRSTECIEELSYN